MRVVNASLRAAALSTLATTPAAATVTNDISSIPSYALTNTSVTLIQLSPTLIKSPLEDNLPSLSLPTTNSSSTILPSTSAIPFQNQLDSPQDHSHEASTLETQSRLSKTPDTPSLPTLTNTTTSTSHHSIMTPLFLPNSTSVAALTLVALHSNISAKTMTSSFEPIEYSLGYTLTTVACDEAAETLASSATQTDMECHNGWRWTTHRDCTPLPPSKIYTTYIVVQTSTVTHTGKKADYKPPFPTHHVPNFCPPIPLPLVPTPPLLEDLSVVTETYTFDGHTTTATITLDPPLTFNGSPITTFVTIDKNPAVVFTSDLIPDFSQNWRSGANNEYRTPVNYGDGGSDQDAASHPMKVAPTYRIVAAPGTVLINGQAFSLPRAMSSTTRVTPSKGGGVFTIGPSMIVGQGHSITIPPTDAAKRWSVVNGIPVMSDGSRLRIGASTYTVPTSLPYTVRVSDKLVTINPSGVNIGGQRMSFLPSTAPNVFVTGADLLTLIGRSLVVSHTDTYTYGPGIPPVTKVINGDTVTIDSTGVMIHDSTLGGISAAVTDTEYQIVGGVTIATMPPSMVVVNNVTYTVGPDARPSTIIIGHQTLTMTDIGVVMASTTISFPFVTSLTATIVGRAPATSMPKETGASGTYGTDDDTHNVNDSDGLDEQDGGLPLRPQVGIALTCLCIIFGVFLVG